MVLEMYIKDQLVDSCVLRIDQLQDPGERESYIFGAVNSLREKWEDLTEDQGLELQFFIKGSFPSGSGER